jgi:hypothetical protein
MLRYFEAMASGTPVAPRADDPRLGEAASGPILGSPDHEERPSANERVVDQE